MDAGNQYVFRFGLIVVFSLAPIIQTYYGRKARPGRTVYSGDKTALKREGWKLLLPHSVALLLMAVWMIAYAADPFAGRGSPCRAASAGSVSRSRRWDLPASSSSIGRSAVIGPGTCESRKTTGW